MLFYLILVHIEDVLMQLIAFIKMEIEKIFYFLLFLQSLLCKKNLMGVDFSVFLITTSLFLGSVIIHM